jgi:hypothetical protein
MSPYLDFDTTPPIRSRYAQRTTFAGAVSEATRLISEATEGQVGIYDSYHGDNFHGYVIKYPGQSAYFEPAPAEDAA